MPQSTSPWIAQLPAEARPRVVEALSRQAVRQVVTVKASGAALAHAPSLDDRLAVIERAKEELEHLEQASEIYRELTGQDLLSDAERTAAMLPVPGSWVEASVAQLVLCLAARLDLEQFGEIARPFHTLTERALSEETEHVNAARVALHDLCNHSPEAASGASEHVRRWLPVALESLPQGGPRQKFLGELKKEAEAIGLPVRLP